MQKFAIVLGGLERSYMQKLALYLRERMGSVVQIGISEAPEARTEEWDASRTIWIGSEQFLSSASAEAGSRWIALGEEQQEDEHHVFQYQSREKLYMAIRQRCGGIRESERGGSQHRIAVTGDCSAGELLAGSLTCAGILGSYGRVLYVNFSECSGMQQLLQITGGQDLGDLMFALQKGREVVLESYVGMLEGVDYILPVRNPMILREVREEDISRLLELIYGAKQYEYVLFVIGTALCGSPRILREADRCWHMSAGADLLTECAGREWSAFQSRCRENPDSNPVEVIQLSAFSVGHLGAHLLEEWVQSTQGRRLEQRICPAEAKKEAVWKRNGR